MSKIIDCHVHAIDNEEFKTYLKTAVADKFINIRGLYIEEMLDPYDLEEFKDNEDMYFIDSVDLEDVDNEIKKVEDDISKYKRIIAIKIYLGYQKYLANDEKIKKVSRFASENNLMMTFHCGEIYNDEGKSVYSEYSDAKYIERLAKLFPNINFIASHINWPNHESVFKMCNDYDNVYTCFSGCNDGETAEAKEKQNQDIANVLNKFFEKYPKTKKKVMYGTDFFAVDEVYADVSSYIKVLDLLNITEEEKEDILKNNAIRAYNLDI